MTAKTSYSLLRGLITILVFSFLTSCGKWKKTTTAEFRLEINKSSTLQYLSFSSGHFLLNELRIEGERKQGKSIGFMHSANGAKADFSTGAFNPSIMVDMPQGTYSSIELEIENKEGVGEPSILLIGTYINSMNNPVPVRFEFNSVETFEAVAEADDGGKEIVLIEGIPANAKIQFDLNYWFGTVTQNMLENAAHTNVMGVPAIVISTTSNEDIYDIVSERIDNATEAVFY